MRTFVKSAMVGVVALAAFSTTASAQNSITYNQAIKSLQTTGKTARRVGVNVDAMKQSIREKIAKEGSENAKSQSTVLKKLATLPQLIVQIQFDTDSALIRPQSWVTVGKIADALHHPLLDDDRFLLVGHTDARGTREHNLDLSDRRALSVASMLIDVYKVSPRRLAVLGLGEEQLRDPGNPSGQTNRRVEFFNLGPK